MERHPTQPAWLSDIIGMDYYGITIDDAYIATGTTRPYGKDIPVVMLEYTRERGSSRGYWYYHDSHEQWYWSGGSVKEVFRKALDEVIKPNFDFDAFDAPQS